MLPACPQGHNAALRHGQILDDGRRLILASGDRQISTWDLQTHNQVATLPAVMGSRVKSVAASRDGATAVVVLYDSSIGVWDLALGACRCMLQKRGARVVGAGHMGGVNAVYLTKDGRLAITVSKVATPPHAVRTGYVFLILVILSSGKVPVAEESAG